MQQTNSSKVALFLGKHHEALLNIASEGVLSLTPEGTIVYANPAAVSIIGISEEKLLGQGFAGLFPIPHRKTIERGLEVMVHERMCVNEICGTSSGNKQLLVKIVPVENNGHCTAIVILEDVSKQLKMEAKIQRSEKMEAIGILAGGVAHNLNNILCGLVSYPELLLLQLPEDNPLRKPIRTIQKAGEKAAAVVQDLLMLARRGVSVSSMVNLNHLISERLGTPEYEQFKRQNPKISLQTRLSKDLWNMHGSQIHLSKTIMNLLSNAAENMPEGGDILISTENRYLDKPIKGYRHFKEGDYVVVSVSDNGAGLSSDDMERIFEPFYTQKKMGWSGTGLGMAVAWGTVEDHKGYIEVESTLRMGTAFTLYLPATLEEMRQDKSGSPISSISGDGESVLIVDDVREQREVASAMLKQLGYAAHSVASGEEAVRFLETNKVDLVVLDMIMAPGMDGLDTYRKIIELHPGQKAIIASGYSETGRVRELQCLGAGAYVNKPFLLSKLGLAVKEELAK